MTNAGQPTRKNCTYPAGYFTDHRIQLFNKLIFNFYSARLIWEDVAKSGIV